MQYPIVLASKITPPTVTSNVIWRPRLAPYFAHARGDVQGTLIIAPAGFGKTTLVASWLAHAEKTLPAAWLTLDEADNDPERFIRYLTTVLANMGIKMDTASSDSHHEDDNNSHEDDDDIARSRLDALLSACEAANQHFVLVLDNCGLINDVSLSHGLLAYFISHLPSKVHLIIISRRSLSLGLSRWRLEDRLQQVTEGELGFTQSEISELFSLERQTLPLAEAQRIHEFTRGWPAAIKLLVQNDAVWHDEEKHPNRRSAILDAAEDYLLEEVFSHLAIEQRDFLLVTAQIDLFCPSLAEEIVGIDRASVNRVLDILLTERLFIEEIPKDDMKPWYRYHPLFSAALRRQALKMPGLQIADILKRAGAWFERNDNLNQAALCANQIQDYDQIISLMVRYWRGLYMEDRMYMLYQWGKMLPDEALLAAPQVCSILSLAALLAEDVALSVLCDEVALAHYVNPDVLFYAEATAIHAHICSLLGHYEEAREATEAALAHLPQSDYYLRSSTSQTGILSSEAPDWLRYRNTMLEFLAPTLAHGKKNYICNYHAFLAFAESCLGNFTAALGYAEKATSLQNESTYPYRAVSMNVYYARMVAAYHRGAIGEAELSQQQYHTTTKESFALRDHALSVAYEALFEFLHGNLEKADEVLLRSVDMSPYGLFMVVLPLDFLVHLDEEHLLDFPAFLKRTAEEYGDSVLWQRLHFMTGFIRGEFSLLPRLRKAVKGIEEERRLDTVHGHLLLSLFEEKDGNHSEAVHALKHALDQAAPEHITQLFCNDWRFVLPVLERLQQSMSPDPFTQQLFVRLSQIATGEAGLTKGEEQARLTPRENDVVYLLISGYSPEDISHRLSISKETVRKHIANVYTKLGVHSRTQLLLRLK